MIRITHKELAEILGISPNYSRVLLHRAGVRLRQENLHEVMEVIFERALESEDAEE